MSDTDDSPKRGFGLRNTGPSSGRSGNGDAAEEEQDKEVLLSDDDTVDVGEEEASVHTHEVLDRLEKELVGLEPVKARIREIGDLLLVDRLRRKFGISSTRPSLHMSFTGSPGTGKTTVALRMAELLHRLGYLRKGHLVAVTRDDLVGQYIGHTAPKTKEVLKRAMGGVLFIDEAYYLYRQENERDYGQETVEILLQVMEQERENIVVILAGYKDRMDRFFQSNPGMGSRIAHHIHFPDYSLDELVAIGQLMLREQQYELSEDAEKAFREYLDRRMSQPRFANARSVRNALERARLRQATRIVSSGGTLSKIDLVRIEAEDILKSRVFSDTEHDNPDGVRDTEDTRAGDPDESPADGSSSDGDEDVRTTSAAAGDDWSTRDDTTSDDDEPGPGTIEYGMDLDADDEPAGGPGSQAAAPG